MTVYKPTAEEIKQILDDHRKWLYGSGGKRAIDTPAILTSVDLTNTDLTSADLTSAVLRGVDLTNADLRGADLSSAVLRSAVLTSAVLTSADLTSADLRGAVLRGANLTNAVLRRAVLTNADLTGADLTNAVLRGADLSSVDLTNADLRGADLSSAVLRGAILTSADLTGADLTSADLRGADLTSAIGSQLVLARTEIVPREGEIYGWKKCYGPMCESRIVKLRIPAEARRSNALGRKCRAEFADVLSIESVDAKTKYETAISIHDSSFEYALGKRVQCREWNTNRLHECSGGIHFYLTREEAEAHY